MLACGTHVGALAWPALVAPGDGSRAGSLIRPDRVPIPELPQMTARGLHCGQGLRNSPRSPAEPRRPRCLAQGKRLEGCAPLGKSLRLGGGGSRQPRAAPAPAATLRLATGVSTAGICHPSLAPANTRFLPCKLRVSKQRGWLALVTGFRGWGWSC